MQSFHNTKDEIEEIDQKRQKHQVQVANACGTKKEKNHQNSFQTCIKPSGIQGQIRKLIVNNQEITHKNTLQKERLFSYEILVAKIGVTWAKVSEATLSAFKTSKKAYC